MGLENEENSRIQMIISKYVKILQELLKQSEGHDRTFLESYVTQTNIVPHDFFDEEEDFCDQKGKILLKDFGAPYMLFNDLKNSTELLEHFENESFVCFYTAYIYYSSKMLGEILNLFGGKMVECTGDGNYSIFLEDDIQISRLVIEGYNFNKNYCLKDNELKRYLQAFSDDEKEGLFVNRHTRIGRLLSRCHSVHEIEDCEKMLLNYCNIEKYIRFLFFMIFAKFNKEINSILPQNITKKFFTRIGCLQGNCKITKIEVKGHISQQKLIGSAVHKAAHQASGK